MFVFYIPAIEHKITYSVEVRLNVPSQQFLVDLNFGHIDRLLPGPDRPRSTHLFGGSGPLDLTKYVQSAGDPVDREVSPVHDVPCHLFHLHLGRRRQFPSEVAC